MGAASRDGGLPPWARTLHIGFVVLLVLQCLYCLWQFFVVMRPPGEHRLLLFSQASELDPAFLVVRRLYAVEGWISVGVLALYLAVTEILPRLRRA